MAGIPAKVIGYVDEQDPSLTMKHGMWCEQKLVSNHFISFFWCVLSVKWLYKMLYHADATKDFYENAAVNFRDSRSAG